MPSCRVTNQTARPLNICLKQVTALHFENAVGPRFPSYDCQLANDKVEPGQTIKFKVSQYPKSIFSANSRLEKCGLPSRCVQSSNGLVTPSYCTSCRDTAGEKVLKLTSGSSR
jgi:hypothetical protein